MKVLPAFGVSLFGLIFCLAAAGLAQAAPPADLAPPLRTVGAADPAFRYDGRFDRRDRSAPVVIWEGSRIAVDFEGPALLLRFGRALGQNFFDARVDGAARLVGIEPGRPDTVAWPGRLGAGRHRLVLIKRSEATAGHVSFLGIEVAAGAGVERPAEPAARLRMLFFGDSITAGACDEDGPVDQWEDRRTHNANRSYAALTARAWGADCRNISVSGIGIVAGYVPMTFGQIWDRVYPDKDSPKADLDAWRPDVIFFNFGTNDASFTTKQGEAFPSAFADRYLAVLAEVRAAFPGSELVILRGGMDAGESNPALIAAWEDAVRRAEARDGRIRHFVFAHHTANHPRVADHEKMAEALIRWLRAQPFLSPQPDDLRR